ncbi:type VII secretion protein EssA [Bacillus marasmi]|uniref:type VII secretion protein EssA n=1 Tax=Bacillus marasmi TaxID=1926279 RepID=UPI00164D2D23|nr:type VII secretion protein EssA [Bacillus marasmi]
MKLFVKVFSTIAFLLFGLLSILPHNSFAESNFDISGKMEKPSELTKQDEATKQKQELQDNQESELEKGASDLFKQQTEANTKAIQAEDKEDVKTVKENLFPMPNNSDSEFKEIEKVLFSDDYTFQQPSHESYNSSFNIKKILLYSAFAGVMMVGCVGVYIMLKKWFR